MNPQITFDQKSLNRILNEVPEGMEYIICLKNDKNIYQTVTEQTYTRYSYGYNIKKIIVYNGFIEIHKESFTIDTKVNTAKPKLDNSILFIPFDKIDFIKYCKAEKNSILYRYE